MRHQRGFSLTELLIVVAVIGVIAVIAVPSLLGATYRSKQKRTMADMRTIAGAVAAYGVDRNHIPSQPVLGPIGTMTSVLQPTYIVNLPVVDGWDQPFQYGTGGAGTIDEYTLISYAKGGAASGPASGPTTNFDDDLILAGGSFVTWPQGAQSQ